MNSTKARTPFQLGILLLPAGKRRQRLGCWFAEGVRRVDSGAGCALAALSEEQLPECYDDAIWTAFENRLRQGQRVMAPWEILFARRYPSW